MAKRLFLFDCPNWTPRTSTTRNTLRHQFSEVVEPTSTALLPLWQAPLSGDGFSPGRRLRTHRGGGFAFAGCVAGDHSKRRAVNRRPHYLARRDRRGSCVQDRASLHDDGKGAWAISRLKPGSKPGQFLVAHNPHPVDLPSCAWRVSFQSGRGGDISIGDLQPKVV
jgi:hypothetical protein